MKRIIQGLLVFIYGGAFCNAQQAISSAGGEASGTGGTVSFTIGQTDYISLNSNSGMISQGIQQPFEIMVVTGIGSDKEITLECTIYYPNPATDFSGGENLAGGKLKEMGITHWRNPNTGATNESGFTALPAGYRSYNAAFADSSYTGLWWSSTEFSSSNAWYRYLGYWYSLVNRNHHFKQNGMSVRCIRD
jgi:hypothetical protein